MTQIDPEDAARELDKAADVLYECVRYFEHYFEHYAAMNAALHLAPEVRPAPLAVRVAIALDEARRSAERFRTLKPEAK